MRIKEARYLPGKLGQFSEDGLHVKNLAGDEETDSNRSEVDNPGCNLRRILLKYGLEED